MSEPLTYMVRGEVMTREAFERTADKPKAKTSSQPKSWHKGWKVVGHPPLALEEARKEHALDITEFRRRQESGRSLNGMRNPGEWDEARWRMTARKKPVRTKPYELYQSALDCKVVAERGGWLDVELVEMKQGKAEGGEL